MFLCINILIMTIYRYVDNVAIIDIIAGCAMRRLCMAAICGMTQVKDTICLYLTCHSHLNLAPATVELAIVVLGNFLTSPQWDEVKRPFHS